LNHHSPQLPPLPHQPFSVSLDVHLNQLLLLHQLLIFNLYFVFPNSLRRRFDLAFFAECKLELEFTVDEFENLPE